MIDGPDALAAAARDRLAAARLDAARDRAQARTWAAALLLSLALVVLYLGFARLVDRQQAGIECLLADLSAHRANSYAADRTLADAYGTTIDSPADAPPMLDLSIRDACEPFLR